MPEQQAWQEAGKWVAGLLAFIASIRAYFKARNTNHADRILRLERESREDRRVMSEVREQMEELDIRVGSTERRTRQLEVNANDLDREVRDNLQRMIEQIDRRLHHQPREQPEQR